MKHLLIILLFFVLNNGFSQTGPGGVGTDDGTSNLLLWLDANSSVEEAPSNPAENLDLVTTWKDLSGNNNHATTGTSPIFRTNQHNGFPAVNFNGSSMYLSLANPNGLPTGGTARTYLAVAEGSTTAKSLLSHGINNAGERVDLTNSSTESGVAVNGHRYSAIFGSAPNLRMHTCEFPFGSTMTNEFQFYTNASVLAPSTLGGGSPVTLNTGNVLAQIGTNYQQTSFFNGNIAELIIFNKELNSAEFIIIHNYLAAKYNLAIANDIYDEDNAGAGNYDYEVAGIGRVDASNIHDDSQGTGIIRVLNPSNLDDNEYFIWGHDNTALSFTETTDIPSGTLSRLDRVWRTSEVNSSSSAVDVGSLDFRFDLSSIASFSETLLLLVDTDNDGSFNDETPISGATSLGSDIYQFSGISSIVDNSRFTLGLREDGPGGIINNLDFWLRADAGVTGASSIKSWNDQSRNKNNATDNLGSYNGPELTLASNDTFNYNPAVRFDSANSEKLLFNSAINAGELIVVTRDPFNDLIGYKRTISGGSNQRFFSHSNFKDGTASGSGAADAITYDFTGDNAITHIRSIPLEGISPLSSNRGFKNGRSLTVLTSSNNDNDQLNPWTNDAYLGAREPGIGNIKNHFSGDIAEVIMFSQPLSNNNRKKIESYLAVKYGITLDNTAGGTAGDYINSAGTIIWDASANIGYHNDIVAIGRDDKSQLGQVKSTSVNTGSMIILEAMGEGTNANNSFVDLNDEESIIIGHDGGSTSPIITEKHNSYKARTSRIWKSAVTGTPGAVTIKAILTNTGEIVEYGLHTDNNTDFRIGSTNYVCSNIIGDTLIFDNVILNDGEYFTIGIDLISPGGVSKELTMWLKGGIKTTEVAGEITDWEDQSGNGYHASSPANGPNKISAGLNYNSSINFDDANNEYLSIGNGIISTSNSNDIVTFIVSKANAIQNSYITSQVLNGGELFQVSAPYGDGNYNLNFGNTGISTNWTGSTGNFDLFTSISSTGSTTPSGNKKTVYRNGEIIGSNSLSDGTKGTGSDDLFIGSLDGTSHYFNGEIAEILMLQELISELELEKINTYLCVKYGITKNNVDDPDSGIDDRDYIATDGTIIWDYSLSPNYHNDVIAIGREESEGLDQKQSKTNNDITRIFIDALTTDNASNTGSISNDRSYIVMGHNNGLMKATDIPSVEAPVGIYSRIDREWKVSNTNFSDNYSIELELSTSTPISLSDLRLLVDDDGDFSNASVFGSPDVTFAFGSIIISGIGTNEIPLNSTKFITLGSISPSTPLPIELLSFEANVNENQVDLKWMTASELNNDYFTVERSLDTKNWEEIIFVSGATNSNQIIEYFDIDHNPIEGLSYYRLKQTDFNDDHTYSNIVPVKFVNPNNLYEGRISLFPNPVSYGNTVNVEIENILGKELLISLRDTKGIEFYTKILIDIKDGALVAISIRDNLPKGVYLVTASSVNKLYSQKLIVE